MAIAQCAAMNRRDFCVHTCQVVSAATLASLMEGCGGNPAGPDGGGSATLTTLTGTFANGVVSVAIDPSGPLASVGGAAFVRASNGAFLVFRAAQDAFNVMTAVCTHEGCDVTGISGSTFVCPCHGSQFNSTGSVVKGPASRPLQRFTANFANNTLTFS
jgi:cytochrome b6-f complex iron-sulfur subunit